MLDTYQPRTHQQFWCKKCDRVSVDSEKPETGSFFNVFGHMWDRETKEYDGEYVGVMFAVCTGCLNTGK
jgi:hypothetical protein